MSLPFKSAKTLFRSLKPDKKIWLFVSTKSKAIFLFAANASNGTTESSPKSRVSLLDAEFTKPINSMPLSKPVKPIFSKNIAFDVKSHIKTKNKIIKMGAFHFLMRLRMPNKQPIQLQKY